MRNTSFRKQGVRSSGDNKRKITNEVEDTGEKRKKRLKYQKVGENWGQDDGDQEQIAKNRFLTSGPGTCRIGAGNVQTCIKVYSAKEVLVREIIIDIIKNIPTNHEKEPAQKMPDVSDPEGWKNLVNILDNGIINNNKSKFVFKNTIKCLFRRQDKMNFEKEMASLEKEQRLAIIQVKKRAWVGMREKFQRRKWAEECLEKVLMETRITGRATIIDICTELIGEMIDKSMILGEWRLEDKDRRLEKARMKKAELRERLESKKGRLDSAEKGKEQFQANLNM